MKKGFVFLELLIVLAIILSILALLLPLVSSVRQSVIDSRTRQQEQQELSVSIAESGVVFEQGDFAYLALNGRKVQVTSVQGKGMYWVRYSDDSGRLEEVSIHYFELMEESELRQTLR